MADTEKELTCPACNCKMTKLYIPEYKHYIDICLDGCGGMYFDNRELEHFDEKHENIDKILELIKDKNFKEPTILENRICPACGAKMVQNPTSYKRTTIIDCCYNCGGKFLDNKELESIRNEYDNETDRKNAFNAEFTRIYAEDIEEATMEQKKQAKHKKISKTFSRTITYIVFTIFAIFTLIHTLKVLLK